MDGTKQDAARLGRAAALKKQKSLKSPKKPPNEAKNVPRFSFGKKSPKPVASQSKKGQSLSRSRATSPRSTRPNARVTPPRAVRPTNVHAQGPTKPRTTSKPKSTIKAARGSPFGSGASSSSSSSSSSAGSSYSGGVVPLAPPPRTPTRSGTTMALPRASSRSRSAKSRTAVSPATSTTRNAMRVNDTTNISITSSNLGVVPITSSGKAKVEDDDNSERSRKSIAESILPYLVKKSKKVEDDDNSERSRKSIAESILPYLVKKPKVLDIRDAAAHESEQKETNTPANESGLHTALSDDNGANSNTCNESSRKEADIHQDDNQGENHHHRRAHAAFRGSLSSESADKSQPLPVGDSAGTNVQLIESLKSIEKPSNAATIHKVVDALQTERENTLEAKRRLRETIAELDRVKKGFSDAQEAYSTENFRLNNKLTRMMDKVELLEHEMAVCGKTFVYPSCAIEPEYYNPAVSPSTRYGARSPRAMRLSKIPSACVDAFSHMNPCWGSGGTEEQVNTCSSSEPVTAHMDSSSFTIEGEMEEETYFSRPSSDTVARE